MEWFVRAFVKASLVWLALGVTLGVAMAAYPQWVVYRPAHLHMTLLGFVTMMIYGVAYHVIPRFTGFALYSRKLAGWHWWMANVGLALLALGFILRPHLDTGATPVLATGGVVSALAAYTFVYGIWRTMDGPAGMRRATERVASSPGAKLPVAGSGAPGAR